MRKLLPVILGLLGLIAGVGAGYVLRPAPDATEAAGPAGATTEGDDTTPSAAAKPAEEPPKSAQAGSHPEESAGHPAKTEASASDGGGQGGEGPASATEFVKLNNQFVVPIIRADEVASLVILSLTLEVKTGSSEAVFAAEPKLRDSFLQVLFDYANANGFDGAFTQSGRMAQLRKALSEPARAILGDTVADVLIVDIVRQDT